MYNTRKLCTSIFFCVAGGLEAVVDGALRRLRLIWRGLLTFGLVGAKRSEQGRQLVDGLVLKLRDAQIKPQISEDGFYHVQTLKRRSTANLGARRGIAVSAGSFAGKALGEKFQRAAGGVAPIT